MILVVGCGRLGASFATRMADEGRDVTIVDCDRQNFSTYLPEGFKGRKVAGMEIDEDVLRKAGIDEAEAVVIVSRDENTNMMVADLVNRVFGKTRVIVRLDQPKLRELYEKAGFEVLSPINEATASLTRRVAALGQV